MTNRHRFGSRSPVRAGSLLLLAFLPVSGCFCEDPDLKKVAPKIEIIDPFVEGESPCAVLNIRECAYAFGDVEITSGRFFKFRIYNDSPIPLTVEAINVEGDPAFTLNGNLEFPLVVGPQADELEPTEITIRFTPTLESTVTGTVTIISDGENLEDGNPDDPSDDEHVVIDLTGNGLDLGRPEIVVSPEACNFGEVGVNVAAFCDVTIENIGTRDLSIDIVAFSSDTTLALDNTGNFDTALPGFGSQTFVFVPLFVAPGTATSVRLFANPPTPAAMTGTWIIGSNDPSRPEVEVPLNVQGAEAPTAIAEVLSINGTPNTNPSPQVQPLDDVTLTGVNSVASNVDGYIVSYHWEIVEQPAESSVILTSPDAETTGFQFDSASGTFTGLDVAGTFVIALTVTDDRDLVSTNEATVTLNSIPQEALHIQLTWDSPDYDFDLHVEKDGGPWCSQQSCYYGNCNASNSFFGRPEWDGLPGETDGDPSLDIDDLSGYGPENINIDAPVSGDYRIGVHAYSSLVDTETYATLKVFINGALAYEDSRLMASGRDFWEVSEVQWNNGAAIVFPVGNYSSNWSCP
jgi:hypothetical protein